MAAIYERAAGLGDVVTETATEPVNAVFVAGGRAALDRYASQRTGLEVLTRDEYRAGLRTAANEQAWAVWMIIGLATLFAALALVNTAAMTTSERRAELATIRLLGGTTRHRHPHDRARDAPDRPRRARRGRGDRRHHRPRRAPGPHRRPALDPARP